MAAAGIDATSGFDLLVDEGHGARGEDHHGHEDAGKSCRTDQAGDEVTGRPSWSRRRSSAQPSSAESSSVAQRGPYRGWRAAAYPANTVFASDSDPTCLSSPIPQSKIPSSQDTAWIGHEISFGVYGRSGGTVP